MEIPGKVRAGMVAGGSLVLLGFGGWTLVAGQRPPPQAVETAQPAQIDGDGRSRIPVGKEPVSDKDGDLAGFVDADQFRQDPVTGWPMVSSALDDVTLHGLPVTTGEGAVVGQFTLELGYLSNDVLADARLLRAEVERKQAIKEQGREEVEQMMEEFERNRGS